jgi:hypothetical protein
VDRRITPLYQHLFHIHHPHSLFFIGVVFQISAFAIFDVQVRCAVESMMGRVADWPTKGARAL